MGRCYFYVSRVDGSWVIELREPAHWTAPIRYASKEDAIQGATRLAKAEWTATGNPTAVRVRHGKGDWSDVAAFGREPPALITPVS